MSRIPTYDRDPYRTEMEAEVIAAGDDGGRPFAVLDDTLFFPEGGGQPADQGRLGEARVLDVQKAGGEIRHFLDRPAAPGPVRLALDWQRRWDHMQQHTAQHLISCLALERFGWRTTAFHLGAELSDIELAVPALSRAQLDALEDAVAAEVRANRALNERWVTAEEFERLPVRSRGLPAEHEGDLRLVEIEGLDLNTCGGTHVCSTGEVEAVKLLHTEALRGGTRLYWVAGARVRSRLAAAEEHLGELRRVLGTRDEELAAVAALKLDQLKEASRRQNLLEKRLAETAAEALAGRAGEVVDAHFDDAEPGFVQKVAWLFAGSGHPGLALLTASGPKGSFFAVAAGGGREEGGAPDAQTAGRRAAELLAGKGGGSGAVFQGRAGSLQRRPEAVEALRGSDARG